jgi:hypothetical protein
VHHATASGGQTTAIEQNVMWIQGKTKKLHGKRGYVKPGRRDETFITARI